MNKQKLLLEIEDTIILSYKFHKALGEQLLWAQEFRELLNSPHTDKKLLQTHYKNGTQ
jgi:hypothetical protein